MNPVHSSTTDLDPVGGELCLDFANTAAWHASDAPVELLASYGDLVAWSVRAGLLDTAVAGRLRREGRRRPADALAVLKRAVALRELIYGIVLAFLRRRPPAASLLEDFNRELRMAFQHIWISSGPAGFAWKWETGQRDLEQMFWPVLRSAAGLFTSETMARVGQCADDRGCGWLFVDTTKNHSRRWCTMGDCGNRAKARRHYRRRHPSKAAGRRA